MKSDQSKSISHTPTVTVRYEQSVVTHITQFVLSANAEEVVLDCSSGPIPGEKDEQILPIHARHALPWSAVRRLSESLNQMIQSYDQQAAMSVPTMVQHQAGLPTLGDSHVN